MKFTRNAINLAITLIVISSMINLSYTKLITNRLSTPKQDWGGGNIYYLDRQNVACPAKTALDGFQLYRPTGNTLAYKYNCRRNCSGMKSGKTYVGKTRPNATAGNKKHSANYLDRHHVSCRNGYALRGFRMGRSGNNIFYSYTCTEALCKSRPRTYTSWQSGGNNEVIYLDRQHIRMQSHHVITGFKLETKYPGGTKYRYRVDYCMLKHPSKKPKPAPKPTPKPIIKPVKPIIPKIPKIVIPKPLPKPRPAPRPIRPKPVPVPVLPPKPVPVPVLPPKPVPTPIPNPTPAPLPTPPAPASSDMTQAPLNPDQIAANAKGKAFCINNCDINPAARLKSCVEPSGLIPCKRCTNKPTKTDPSLKQVCELVCNAHIPNRPCDFYGYLNNKKKAYNVALLAKFGLKILRKFFKK